MTSQSWHRGRPHVSVRTYNERELEFVLAAIRADCATEALRRVS